MHAFLCTGAEPPPPPRAFAAGRAFLAPLLVPPPAERLDFEQTCVASPPFLPGDVYLGSGVRRRKRQKFEGRAARQPVPSLSSLDSHAEERAGADALPLGSSIPAATDAAFSGDGKETKCLPEPQLLPPR